MVEGGKRKQYGLKTQSARPIASVVTVVRNAESTLVETIECALAQTYENFEIIVVDGGSTDNTVSELIKLGDRIDYWMSEPDKGFYSGLNKAIQLSVGDYFIVLNAEDVFIDKFALEKFVSLAINENADLVVSDTLMMNKQSRDGWVRRASLRRGFLINGGIPQQSFLYRRKFFDKVGPFNETYAIAADFEWLLRALFKFSARSRRLVGPNILFRTGGSSSIFAKLENERAEIVKSYFSIFERVFYRLPFIRRAAGDRDLVFRPSLLVKIIERIGSRRWL